MPIIDEKLIKLVAIGAVGVIAIYLTHKTLREGLLLLSGEGTASKEFKKSLARRLRRPEIETMEFSNHEAKFAADIITCDEIDVSFSDIGGMDDKLDEVRDNIVLPLEMWNVLRSKSNLTPCPTGVLLYGKPGTGKTMTAKGF